MKTARDIAGKFDRSGQVMLITGASSGLGAETARALALTGASLILTGRNTAALAEVSEELKLVRGAWCRTFTVDQSDLGSVAALAGAVAAVVPAIDVMICNAGVSHTPQDRLPNGLDARCVINHLSHFLLVHMLQDQLAARGSRVVMLGSAGHKGRPVELADIAWRQRPVDQRVAYGESKSANMLFAVEASRRMAGCGIYVNSVLPGSVMTGLQRHHSPERLEEMVRLGQLGQAGSVFTTVEEGASTSVWAALAPELDQIGGAVLEDCDFARLAGPNEHPWRGYAAHALDPETARQLWNVTVDLLVELGSDLNRA